MTGRSRLILSSLGALHLIAIVGGALHAPWSALGPLAVVSRAYGILSGTGFGYSFFAPEVSPNVIVRFDVKTADGKIVADRLEAGANREAAIRISNIAEAFDGEDETLRKSLAASWAGTIFARHKDAQAVTVIVESCDVPPMAEFRKGEREFRLRLYDATFVWPRSRKENRS